MPAGGASGSGESCESPAHLTSDRARSQWSRGRFFLTPESGGRYSRSLTARACAPWSMSSSSPQRIELCGVTVDVETDHADLARYLRGHFGQVLAPDATSATADVSVRVRWTEGPRETARPGPSAACGGRRDGRAGPRPRWAPGSREVDARCFAADRARRGAAGRQRRPARRPADLRLLRAGAARRADAGLAAAAAAAASARSTPRVQARRLPCAAPDRWAPSGGGGDPRARARDPPDADRLRGVRPA